MTAVVLVCLQAVVAPQQLYCCRTAVPQASLAAANGAGGGPKRRLGDAVGWFKGLGQAATSIVSTGGGRAADAAEDPEYIKVCKVKWHLLGVQWASLQHRIWVAAHAAAAGQAGTAFFMLAAWPPCIFRSQAAPSVRRLPAVSTTAWASGLKRDSRCGA